MKLVVGQTAVAEREFTLEEVKTYCAYSLDENPMHWDLQVCRDHGFEGVLVPGLLVTSLFGGLMGTRLPGFGTVHLHQDIKFIRPIFTGEKVKVVLKVEKIREDKPIVTYSCTAYKSNGEVAQEGTAVVKVPQAYLK